MAIQDPEVLAWELYAEGVVTDSAIDKVHGSIRRDFNKDT